MDSLGDEQLRRPSEQEAARSVVMRSEALDRNLLEIDPHEIAGTEVKKTIFADEVVYEAN